MTKKPSQPMPLPAIPKFSEGQLEPLFRRLNLAHTRRISQEVADRAEKENWTYRDFLALLLAEEVAHRKQTRLQRFTRKAHFPFFKTIDEFDFSLQSTLRCLSPASAARRRGASKATPPAAFCPQGSLAFLQDH